MGNKALIVCDDGYVPDNDAPVICKTGGEDGDPSWSPDFSFCEGIMSSHLLSLNLACARL